MHNMLKKTSNKNRVDSTEKNLFVEIIPYIFSLLERSFSPNHVNLYYFHQGKCCLGPYDSLLDYLEEDSQKKIIAFIQKACEEGRYDHLNLTSRFQDRLHLKGFSVGQGYFLLSFPDKQSLGDHSLPEIVSHIKNISHLLPLPVWCRDQEQNIIYANGQYQSFVETVNAELFQQTKAKYLAQLALNQDHSQALELQTTIGGEVHEYQIQETPIIDSQTGAHYTIGYGIDRTAEHHLERKLERLEGTQKKVIDALPMAAIVFNQQRHILHYNHSFLEMWPLNEVEISQIPDHPALLEFLYLKRLLPEHRDMKSWREEQFLLYRDINSNYKTLWFLPDGRSVHVTAVGLLHGGIIMFFEDVTSKRDLEKNYQDTANNLQDALNSLPLSVGVFNEECRLIVFNDEFSTLAQNALSKDVHLSQVSSFLEAYPQIADFCHEILSNLETGTLSEEYIKEVNDKECVFLLKAKRLETGYILFTCEDITAHAKFSKTLKEKNETLTELSFVREMFFRQISGQLREPLSAISGYAEALNSEIFGSLTEKQKEYLTDIHDASQDILELTDNLIDIARLKEDVDGIQAQFNTHNFYKMCGMVQEIVKRKLQKKNLTLTVDIPEETMIYGDYSLIRQAILQILYNAIDVSNNGQSIIMSYSPVEKTFTVMDYGCGFDDADLTKILSEQVDQNTHNGYGLRYIKRVCDLHQLRLVCQKHEQPSGTKMSIIGL